MANRCPTEAWQSPTDTSLEKSVKCLGAVSRIPSGSKRPDRCLQATEEQENREDPHRAGPSIDVSGLTNAAVHTPRARMGVRGSGPNQNRVLLNTPSQTGFPDPISPIIAPYFPFDLLRLRQPHDREQVYATTGAR